MLVRSRWRMEDFISVEVDPALKKDTAWGLSKSTWSMREFGALAQEAMKNASLGKGES